MAKSYFSLNHHVGNYFGNCKELCHCCCTCLSVLLLAFLSRSDLVAHRFLLCLGVRFWEIYDVIFIDILSSFRIPQFLQQLHVNCLVGKTIKIHSLTYNQLQAPIYSNMISMYGMMPN